MKKSLLKLLSSAYILLISVILIVISAYAWMVISDSPMAGGMGMNIAGGDAIGLPDKIYSIWDGSTVEIDTIQKDQSGAYIITNAAEFVTVMRLMEQSSMASENITMILEADISLADIPWDSVKINDSYSSSTITILGNGKELVCLTAPLFESGAAGESAIIIKDVTIAKSNISSSTPEGVGAFFETIEGVKTVTFENCHLIDSRVAGSDAVGGFIGSTAGKQGTVETTVTITDCSVENSELFGIGTVGGFIGKAGTDPATVQTLENCTIDNTTLISTNKTVNGGIGTMVGVANLGDIYVIDCVATNVIESGHADDLTDLVYGIEDYGTTGSLTIINNGVEVYFGGNKDNTITVTNAQELIAAMKVVADETHEGDITINIANDIDMTGVDWTPTLIGTKGSTATVTINGNTHSITNLSAPLLAGGVRNQEGQEKLIINDLMISDSNMVSSNEWGVGAFIECVAGLESVELNNCHLIGSTLNGNYEKGTRTGGLIGWTSAAHDSSGNSIPTTVTVTRCSVESSEITSNGTVGGIIGHAGYNDDVTHVLTDCYVENTKLTSTEAGAKGIGTMIGTINLGKTYITHCTASNVTEVPVSGEQNTEGVPFGRLKMNGNSLLVITESASLGDEKFTYTSSKLLAEVWGFDGMMKANGIYSDGFAGEIEVRLNGDIDLSGGLGGLGDLFSVTPTAETTAPIEETTAPVEETTTPVEETTVP